MKKLIILATLTLICKIQSQAQSADEQAIKAVLQKETYTAYQHDYTGWQTCWVHDKTVFIGWNNRDGSYSVRQGWNGVDELVKGWLTNLSDTRRPDFINKNMLIVVEGDLAYATYDEYSGNEDNSKYTLSKIYKVLRKVNGEWKFVSVCSYWNYDYKFTKAEIQS